MAIVSYQEGAENQKEPLAQVMKISQFSVRYISRKKNTVDLTKVLNDTTLSTKRGAPLTHVMCSPVGDSTIATAFLETGSKG